MTLNTILHIKPGSPLGLAMFVLILFSSFSCRKEDGMTKDPDPMVDTCDQTLSPIIFVHGFLASGDTYAQQVLRFASNGHCDDRLFVFDWNSVAGGNQDSRLDSFVNVVLQKTQSTKVILAGHSAGSNLVYQYCNQPQRALKVDRLVYLAGTSRSQPAGPNGEIPTLNIWSTADLIVAGGNMTGATNLQYADQDHYQVATSVPTFEAMFEFIHGKKPANSIKPQNGTIKLAGKALTLGDNSAMAGAEIAIYALDSTTGFRDLSKPVLTSTVDENGSWGPVDGVPGVYYEFELKGKAASDRVVHYYRLPFIRSDYNIYLRGIPPPTSLAGLLLAGLPKDDNQTVAAIFAANQAVIHGRDQLFFGTTELSTEVLSPAIASNIAYFLYDANNNKQSDGSAIATFSFVPFLTGVDQFIPTASPVSLIASLNGKKMHFRNYKSESEGIVVLVFD
jgi:pimeloyl-ACP methyl ester carboxylesterase